MQAAGITFWKRIGNGGKENGRREKNINLRPIKGKDRKEISAGFPVLLVWCLMIWCMFISPLKRPGDQKQALTQKQKG